VFQRALGLSACGSVTDGLCGHRIASFTSSGSSATYAVPIQNSSGGRASSPLSAAAVPSATTTASLTTIARKPRCIRASGVSPLATISSQPASAADTRTDRTPGRHRGDGARAGQTPRRQPPDRAQPEDDRDGQTQEARHSARSSRILSFVARELVLGLRLADRLE